MSRITALFALLALCCNACLKTEETTMTEGAIRLSADTLRFDTVFSTAGSVTSGLILYNREKKAVRIPSIQLGGGPASMFQLNADGVAGPIIQNQRIEAGDSIYLFVSVRVDPNNTPLPFLVKDSILIKLQDSERKVMLEAWGQNARYLRNVAITGDQRFDNALPYVILGGLRIGKNARLTIEAGTRIHLNADAPLLVDGTLVAEGTVAKPILFTGNRLDEAYKNLPASWPGIYFRESSINNRLVHARIMNAYNGVVAEKNAPNGQPKLLLDRCVIDNAYEGGLIGAGSTISATNCLISNCGKNVLLLLGGQYQINHCTIASYSHALLPHKFPVVTVQNWDSSKSGVQTYPISVQIDNSILWGDPGSVEQELLASRRGSDPFILNMRNSLFRGNIAPAHTSLTNCLQNQPPQFDSIHAEKRFFNFRIQRKNSPAVDRGLPGQLSLDLDDQPRKGTPDLGAYEKQ